MWGVVEVVRSWVWGRRIRIMGDKVWMGMEIEEKRRFWLGVSIEQGNEWSGEKRAKRTSRQVLGLVSPLGEVKWSS